MSELEYREEAYGEEILAVEPGGIEAIPDGDRHGKAWNLFAVWTSPNLEFATIYVGALGMFFGLSLTQAILGVLLGNGLGALSQYFLTQDGPRYGVPQMILSRVGFGRLGNILPSLFNSLAAGIGWFAVNSISGALALSTITDWSTTLCLIIVAVAQVTIAFIGHNLVQTVEKYLMPYLVVVFGIAAIVIFSKPSVASPESWHLPGAFWLYLGAVYGYSAGWNPFASDYARYLPKTEDPKAAGRFAALGLIIAPSILEIVGLLAVRAGMGSAAPTDDFKNLLGGTLGTLVLLGVVLGSICANVLNVYSGSISFLTMGIKMKTHHLRAIMAVVWGVAGYLVAAQFLDNVKRIEDFLLVMAYWIGPWLGVTFADKILRKGRDVSGLLFANRENVAGPIAFVLGVVVSMYLFSNQIWYTGVFPKNHPALGDIAFPVGFALSFVIYYVLAARQVKSEQ
jgi:NCS1 nucleoside transporter family